MAEQSTYGLEDFESDLDRYSPNEDHSEVAVVIEYDGKRLAIIDMEEESDRGMNLIVVHVGEWNGFVSSDNQ